MFLVKAISRFRVAIFLWYSPYIFYLSSFYSPEFFWISSISAFCTQFSVRSLSLSCLSFYFSTSKVFFICSYLSLKMTYSSFFCLYNSSHFCFFANVRSDLLVSPLSLSSRQELYIDFLVSTSRLQSLCISSTNSLNDLLSVLYLLISASKSFYFLRWSFSLALMISFNSLISLYC